MKHPSSFAVLLLMLLFPLVALAGGDGVDGHGFKLTAFDGDPRDLLTVQRPGRMKAGEFYGSGLFEYARDPLTRTQVFPDQRVEEQVALGDVVGLNLAAGAAVTRWLRLDVAAPVFFASTGLGDVSQGVGLGDVRLGAMLAFLQPQQGGGGFGLGVVPHLDLPTGSSAEFLGQGSLGGGGKLAATLEVSRLTLTADVGAHFNQAVDTGASLGNLTGSDHLLAGFGLGVLLTPSTGVNLEAHLAPALKANEEPGTGSPAEFIGAFRTRTKSGLHVTLGGAGGLSRGIGASTFRVFLGVGYGKLDSGSDRDGDGIIDSLDVCPDVPEIVNGFEDDDGCPDELAKLYVMVEVAGNPQSGVDVRVIGDPATYELASEVDPVPLDIIPGLYVVKGHLPGYTGQASVEVKPGEQDVVLNLEPMSPAHVTVVVLDPSEQPLYGAGISFAGQNAPLEGYALGDSNSMRLELPPGRFSMFVKVKGYALHREDLDIAPGEVREVVAILGGSRVKVTKQAIEILDKVFFEFDKAVILPQSFPLLREVANVILANPDIREVEVAGHTDNEGDDAYNQALSEARAGAVRQFLVDQGVEGRRLRARGYGETAPIDTNATEDGRARNRRVEFRILARD